MPTGIAGFLSKPFFGKNNFRKDLFDSKLFNDGIQHPHIVFRSFFGFAGQSVNGLIVF